MPNTLTMHAVWDVAKESKVVMQKASEDVVVLQNKLATLGVLQSGEYNMFVENGYQFKYYSNHHFYSPVIRIVTKAMHEAED